jgi:hypothetical protein
MACYIPFLENIRPVMQDESWYSNPAMNFAHGKGIINTNVGSGGEHNFILPLLIGFVFKLFGVSLFNARIVSVIAGLFTLIATKKILNLLKYDQIAQFCTLIIFIILPQNYSVFRYARPESISLMLMAFSFYYLLRFMQSNGNLVGKMDGFKYLYLSILFSSIGILAHPYALSFCVASLILVLIMALKSKTFLQSLPHLFVSSIMVLISLGVIVYMSSSSSSSGKNMVESAAGLSSRLSLGAGFLLDKLLIFKLIIAEFVLSPKAIFFVPLMLILFTGLFRKQQSDRLASQIGLLVFVVAFIVFNEECFVHVVSYVIFFSTISAGFVLYQQFNRNRVITITLFMLFGLVNVSALVIHNTRTYDANNTILQKELKKLIPPNSTVVGGLRMWFFAPETNYYTLFRNTKEQKQWITDNVDYVFIYSVNNIRDIQNIRNMPEIDFYKRLLVERNYQIQTVFSKKTKQYDTIYLFHITRK